MSDIYHQRNLNFDDNVDVESFVKSLDQLTSKASVSIDNLLVARKNVQSLADDTNAQLKKNVYKNYALFIETAKEISYLKNEMYQLNHMLAEEQSLMSQMLEVSIGGDRPGLTAIEKKEVAEKVKEDKKKELEKQINSNTHISKELSYFLDKIEGCTGIMETRNRSTVLYSGELMELDINDYKEIQNLFVILLSDGLILSSILKSTSKSQKRYKFQSLFELDNIAVVNVKDPNFKTAFKILMFPSTKVFKAESIQIKNQWLDAFDAAKKQRRTSLSLQRRDSMMFIDGSQGTNVGAKTPISPIDRPYSGILNPFEETELMEDVSEIDTEMLPSWLIDVPEDLDVYVAQRNFEEAVKLVLKVNDHFALYPKCCDGIMQTDLKLRIDHRINELINAISNELKTAPDRSLQTGPRSARRAVILLHKLGKTSLATKLFLNQRSALLKFSLRQQKIEGATLQYIKRMSSVFFTNVKETTKEFQKAFDLNALTSNGSLISPPNSLISDNISINNEKLSPTSISVAPSMSCLMKWTHEQLVYLISLFSRHVFTTQVSTSVAAECVALIRHHCHKLKNIGIDLLYYLDKQLKTDVERLITECKEKLLEAIKLRSNDDKWQPQNYTNTIKITKFIEDMKENGILTIEKFIYDEVRVDLTANTISFAKSYLNTLKDLLKLSTYFTHDLIIEALVTTFKAQMKHIATALKQKHIPSEKKFIEKNATFLLDTILTLSQEFYYEKFGFNCEELSVMHANYAYLKGEIDSRRNSKSNSTPKKYTSTTYL